MAEAYGWKRMLAILAILVIVRVLLSLVAGGVSLTQQQKSVAIGPTGTIFISGVSDDNSPFLETYALDVSRGSLTKVGEDEASLGDFYVFNRNASTFAFIGTTKSRMDAAMAHAASPGSVMQLYRAKVSAPHTLPLPTEAQQITDSDSPSKTELAISDSGMSIAYVAASSSAASASSSVIHVVIGDSDTPVVTGTQPQWYSDTAFYYIAADGVRLFDGATRHSTLVLPIRAQDNFKLVFRH